MGWNADQMPDHSGRRVVVTGANSGIGLAAAIEFARRGAQVVLACRDAEKATIAADRIRAVVPSAAPRVVQLDLADLASVRAVTDAWREPIDLLVNNAGVMAPPERMLTADGFERQFGTNHLGHFALTGLLLPHLLAGSQPRVVTISSLAHRSGGHGVLGGNLAGRYVASQAYSNSKLANLLFAIELQRRAAATGFTSTAAHPGLAATNLTSNQDGIAAMQVIGKIAHPIGKIIGQSARAGALPTLYAATAAEPGSYTGPGLFEVRGAPRPARVAKTAADPQLAADLWGLSEELTGVTYPWP
ncbi:MAG: oxidoreductase [Jatrophihabitans sp.]